MTPSNGMICICGPDAANGAPIPVEESRCLLFARSKADAGRALSKIATSVRAAYTIAWAREELAVLPLDEEGVVLESCTLRLGEWTLEIGAGSRLQPDGNGAWHAAVPEQQSIQLTHRSGERAALYGELVLRGPGPAAGQVELRAAAGGVLLNASIRFFCQPKKSEDKLAGFTYPLFSAGANGNLTMDIAHHPLAHGGAGGTKMTLVAGVPIPSAFLSVEGEALALEMLAGAGTTTAWDPVLKETYSVPKGPWRVHAATERAVDLMCGLSGLEFARVYPGTTLVFVPDGPAFAPNFPGDGNSSGPALTSQCSLSEFPVTTAWAYLSPGEVGGLAIEPGYFSQPVTSGLFQTNNDGFLSVFDVQCAGFPQSGKTPYTDVPAFPIAPYTFTQPSSADEANLYRNFEIVLLSIVRCNTIFGLNWPDSTGVFAQDGPRSLSAIAPELTAPLLHARSATGASAYYAITPQGLYSQFSEDRDWLRLVLALTNFGAKTLELDDLSEQLRAAMLTNQLFLVISDVEQFQKACTVLFSSLTISGWQFDLGIEDWRTDTVLILKFADKTLYDLVNDRSLWSTAAGNLNRGAGTQAVLKAWMQEAEPEPGKITAPEFDYFVNTVMHGDWNGVIFANVKVPPGDFPAELQALAAGLDMQRLKAHHFGVNLSPMQVIQGSIHLSDSSLLGLIFYVDTQDLVYSSVPYDFKVLTLQVLFANSEISSFASRIELLVGELFAQRSTLLNSNHGDNIILNGVMQRHGDTESYTFSEEGVNTFAVESLVLNSVVVNKAQFVTLPQEEGSTLTTARFLMAGQMSFLDHPEFDMFSFGPVGESKDGPASLQYSNMFISMDYQPAQGPTGITGPTGGTGPSGPTGQTEIRQFAFQAGQMSFDLAQSAARPASLYARFPLQVTGMIQGDGSSTPASLGYIGVTTPLVGRNFSGTWFGLQMALSLGSMGGLASMAPFTASMLAAWAPSARDYNALLGLKLPGSPGGGKSLSIQGPLKLSIQDIGMLFNASDPSYLMKFTNIALTLFSLRFPPGGTTNLLLFGDPDPKAKQTTLGWYAAYMKNPGKKKDDKSDGGKKLPAAKTPQVIEASAATQDGCGCGNK